MATKLPGKVPGQDRMPGILSASLLAADGAALGEEAALALGSGADWLHFDLMVLARFLVACCAELSIWIGVRRGGAVGLHSLCLRCVGVLRYSAGMHCPADNLVNAAASWCTTRPCWAALPDPDTAAVLPRTGTLSTTGRSVPAWWAL